MFRRHVAVMRRRAGQWPLDQPTPPSVASGHRRTAPTDLAASGSAVEKQVPPPSRYDYRKTSEESDWDRFQRATASVPFSLSDSGRGGQHTLAELPTLQRLAIEIGAFPSEPSEHTVSKPHPARDIIHYTIELVESILSIQEANELPCHGVEVWNFGR